jgi:hypothetical protein
VEEKCPHMHLVVEDSNCGYSASLGLLSLGKLDRDSASELKHLLMEDLKKARAQNDIEHEKDLGALIKILDSYIIGDVDLMLYPDVVVSNIT